MLSRTKRFRSLVFCGLFTSWASVHGDPFTEDGIVAKTKFGEITQNDLKKLFNSLDATQKKALLNNSQLLDGALRNLIARDIIYQEAVKSKWDQQTEIATQLKQIRVKEITESYLKFLCSPPPDFPSDIQLQQVYEANKSLFLVLKQYRLAQIFLAEPGVKEDSAQILLKTRLDAVISSEKKGIDFGSIARAMSDDKASLEKGGDIGWVSETQILPEIKSQMLSEKVNSLLPPIQLKDGIHIIKITGIKESHVATLEEIRSQLSLQLRAQRTEQNIEALIAKTEMDNAITISQPSKVNDLLKPASNTNSDTATTTVILTK